MQVGTEELLLHKLLKKFMQAMIDRVHSGSQPAAFGAAHSHRPIRAKIQDQWTNVIE